MTSGDESEARPGLRIHSKAESTYIITEVTQAWELEEQATKLRQRTNRQ